MGCRSFCSFHFWSPVMVSDHDARCWGSLLRCCVVALLRGVLGRVLGWLLLVSDHDTHADHEGNVDARLDSDLEAVTDDGLFGLDVDGAALFVVKLKVSPEVPPADEHDVARRHLEDVLFERKRRLLEARRNNRLLGRRHSVSPRKDRPVLEHQHHVSVRVLQKELFRPFSPHLHTFRPPHQSPQNI